MPPRRRVAKLTRRKSHKKTKTDERAPEEYFSEEEWNAMAKFKSFDGKHRF
jgi:hypothetical protein